MRKTLWTFLISVLVISNVKDIEAVCNNVNNKLMCSSLTEISSRTLSSVKNIGSVTNIKVENNPELHVSSSAFKSCVSLEVVQMNYNKINKIFSNTFKDLPLTAVFLKHNDIQTIFSGAFFNLPRIVKLDLRNNKLTVVSKGVFANLPLQELTLSRNIISSIDDMALENLPNLKKLRLDNNKLKFIAVSLILTYPERLEILWLHNNSLTMVTSYMLLNLSNLTLLNLGFNSISTIEPNSFQQTPKLNTLVLTHNHLKEIDGAVLPTIGLNHLEKLYLDNNKLMFLSSNFLARLNVLKRITIIGNPWFCSCLDFVRTHLSDRNISEKCAEVYDSGRRPICVGYKSGESFCSHTYNEELSAKYEVHKKKYPLHKSLIDCYL